MITLWLAFSVAHAQDTADEGDGPDAGGSDADVTPASKAPKAAGPKPSWEREPVLLPVAGLSAFTGADGEVKVGIGLGAQAGFRYWQDKPDPFLMGMSRVRGEYLLGAGLNGPEVRVGSFLGPWWKFIGAQTGPDIFWQKYSVTVGDQKYSFDPTVGLSWPVMANLVAGPISVHGAVEPGFYFAADDLVPEVDWDKADHFGFGDEFTYQAGVGLDLKAARVGLDYTITTSGYGVEKGLGVSFRVGGG